MKATINVVDYVVLCATVLLSVFTGLYYAIKERNHSSAFRFHLGAGKLKALPVALSLLVTFESSIFFLGFPAEVYIHGFIFWLSNFGQMIGFSNLLFTSVPLFFPLKITSVYEYLEIRYGSSDIRRFATVLSSLSMLLYAGIVLFGAGTALESVTHIPAWGFVIAMTAIAVIYTALGGLKAVVATDVIQGIIMLTAIVAVIIKGTLEVGGVSSVIALNEPSRRTVLADFDPDPMVRHTFWSLVFGNAIRTLSLSFKQPAVQRLNSTATKCEARKVVFIAVPSFMILQLLVMYEGLVAYAYFANKGCDPLASGDISNPNQIISYTVLEMFQSSSGLPGLFLGALGSASLSTISSLLSSISAVVSEDVVRQYYRGVTDAELTKISKVLVVFTGIVCCLIAILIGQLSGPLSQISSTVIGSVDAPLTALFLMSVYLRFTTRKGVMIGAVAGLVFGCWISGGYNFSPGRKITPWLQLGPTDQCFNISKENGSLNLANPLNGTISFGLFSNRSFIESTTIDTDRPGLYGTEQVIYGVDNLYSVSYIYFPALIMIVTVTVALIAGKLIKPIPEEKAVPPHLVLSLRERLLCCFQRDNDIPQKTELSKMNEF